MVAPWPGGLPTAPLLGSLQVKEQDAVLKFSPDIPGMTLRRARYNASVAAYGFSFYLTIAQLATLMTFFKTTLSMGALSFTFTDPVTAAVKTFSFAGPPDVVAISAPGYYRVNLSLIRAAE